MNRYYDPAGRKTRVGLGARCLIAADKFIAKLTEKLTKIVVVNSNTILIT